MALAYLQIFQDAAEYINLLDDAQRGRILTAMMAYAFQNESPEFESGMEKMAWIALRRMIDQSKASLEGKRAGGKARQQATAEGQQEPADNKQTSADAQQVSAEGQQESAETSNIKESRIKNQESRDKKQDLNGGINARSRFTPPTVEEVRSYCGEKGLRVDPERFMAYYESNGWMVGKNRMKDWHAAVRTWSLRDPPCSTAPKPGKVVREQRYTQREYTHNEDALDKLMRGTTGGVSS